MDTRQLRAAHAADYFARLAAFLGGDITALRGLERALRRVHPADVVDAEALEPARRARALLAGEAALPACALLLRYQLVKPEVPWDERDAAQAVAVLAMAMRGSRTLNVATSVQTTPETTPDAVTPAVAVTPLLPECLEMLAELAHAGALAEHLVHATAGACADLLFAGTDAVLGTACVAFLGAALRALPRPAREPLVHDVVARWRRAAAPGSLLADAVHSLVLAAGCVAPAAFSDAAAFRTDSALAPLATQAHADAVAIAHAVARRLITGVYEMSRKVPARSAVDAFLAVCAARLQNPLFPAAEIMVAGFVATAFGLANVFQNEKYPSYLFQVMDLCYEPLRDAQRQEEPALDAAACAQLVAACPTRECALFVASRLCVRSPAIIGALQSWTPGAPPPAELWRAYVLQWSVSEYFDKLSSFVCRLADNALLLEKHQVEVFRLVSRLAADDACAFHIAWADRVAYAPPLVCESLVSILQQVHHRLPPDQAADAIERVGARTLAPGAPQYKKRMLSLLKEASSRLPALAWRYALVCAADADANVAAAACTLCAELLEAACASAPTSATGSPAEDLVVGLPGCESLLQALSTLDGAHARFGLRRFAATCTVARMQQLVQQLVAAHALETAALFVEANGHFLPPACAARVVGASDSERLLYVRMLDSMLAARPRVLLAPKTTMELFDYLLRRLKLCTEREAEHVGAALGQLVELGNAQVRQQRAHALANVGRAACSRLAAAKSFSDTVFCQLALVASCARFWPVSEDLKKQVVTTLVELALELPPGSTCRISALRGAFVVAARDARLLNLGPVLSLFDSVSQNTNELHVFTGLLLQHLWRRHAHESIPLSKQARLFAINSASSQDASVALIGRYFSRVLERADTDLVALRATAKAVEEKLVAAEQCYTTFLATCFSPRAELAQTAFAAYVAGCLRSPAIMVSKFGAGLQAAVRLHGHLDAAIFLRVWHVLHNTNKTYAHGLIEEVARSLSVTAPVEYLEMCIAGLMATPLTSRDAKLLVAKADSNVLMFEPRSEKSSAHDCIKVLLVHVFTLWLRQKYGFGEYARTQRRQDERDGLAPFAVTSIALNCEESTVRDVVNRVLTLPDDYSHPDIQALVATRDMDMHSASSSPNRLGLSDGVSSSQAGSLASELTDMSGDGGELSSGMKRIDVFAIPPRKRVIED